MSSKVMSYRITLYSKIMKKKKEKKKNYFNKGIC